MQGIRGIRALCKKCAHRESKHISVDRLGIPRFKSCLLCECIRKYVVLESGKGYGTV